MLPHHEDGPQNGHGDQKADHQNWDGSYSCYYSDVWDVNEEELYEHVVFQGNEDFGINDIGDVNVMLMICDDRDEDYDVCK